eukprot:scpid80989/ scgid10611/ 
MLYLVVVRKLWMSQPQVLALESLMPGSSTWSSKRRLVESRDISVPSTLLRFIPAARATAVVEKMVTFASTHLTHPTLILILNTDCIIENGFYCSDTNIGEKSALLAFESVYVCVHVNFGVCGTGAVEGVEEVVYACCCCTHFMATHLLLGWCFLVRVGQLVFGRSPDRAASTQAVHMVLHSGSLDQHPFHHPEMMSSLEWNIP